MSMFICSECGGTFRYSEDSPDDWKPVELVYGRKTTCASCYANLPVVHKPVIKDHMEQTQEAVCHLTYERAGGTPNRFDNWAAYFTDMDEVQDYFIRFYERLWCEAYREITNEEWK